jgi:GntR family transcriptional regulator/MocR family aminotransferase
MQIVMAQFIEKNYLFKHLKNLQKVTQERFDVFTREFNHQNNHLYLIHTNMSSLHVVAKFKQEVSVTLETQIIHELESNGISAYPLSSCFTDVKKETGLILGFATTSPVAIKQKLSLLKKVVGSILPS